MSAPLQPIRGAVRLNVGCGRYPHPDYYNFDHDPEIGRFVESLGMRFIPAKAHQLPVPDSSANVVYASHLLEHYLPEHSTEFGEPTVTELLREWRRVLAPGGELYVAVPDLLTCCARILTESKQRGAWKRSLFGFSKRAGDLHQWGYDWDELCDLLRRNGFEPLGPFRAFLPNPAGDGYDCAGAHGLDDDGKEIPCSLNVRARRPA